MSPGRTFQRERFAAIVDDLAPLSEAHFNEVAAIYGDHVSLSHQTYQALEARDALRIFTLRDNGELTGYCSLVVQNYIHALHLLYAHEDAIYITPPARGRGSEWIAWQDQQLADEGVHEVHRSVKIDHNHGTLLRRHAYAPREVVWVRRLSAPQKAIA